MRPPKYVPHGVGTALLALALFFAGCKREPPRTDYVARVGDQYLTEAEVNQSLEALNLHAGTSDARQQIIEHWVTNALLYREAQRRNLSSDPGVQELLREQERSVLISEITTRLYTDRVPPPSAAEIQRYYDSHRDQLRLREPFLRLRYLATRQPGVAQTVREELASLHEGIDADSVWSALATRYAHSPELSLELARAHHSEGQLFTHQPAVRSRLADLEVGAVAPVFRADSLYHVLQLVERTPPGTIPPLEWVRDQIRQRLTIRARKQMYTREVQRLRNEAQAQDALDIR